MKRTAAWSTLFFCLLLVANAMAEERSAGITTLDLRETSSNMDTDLPSAGRSLFDELVGRGRPDRWNIPFPFSKLIASLSQTGGCQSRCVQTVMIPLGRSLQRSAAAPEFFKYPRIVAAFTADTATTGNFPLLKDRLYLGFQEKANLIEVISFNETAGRFEFQLVKNYGAGMKPKIFYANRAVCVSCHQNQAPIFSRQVWDETNANPEIANRLARARVAFDGLPIRIGVDVPNAVDDATDRANLFSAYESLWWNGCGTSRRCRTRALVAALQYRLTNERRFDFQSERFQQDFLVPFKKNWQTRWPDGLKIPSNDIPNRDPLQFKESEQLADVPARFEALLPLGHKEIWQWETDRFRLVKGIGEFFSVGDIQLIADKLNIRPNAKLSNFAALDQAVEAMLLDPNGQAALDSATIRRGPLRDALFQALGIKRVKSFRRDELVLTSARLDDDESMPLNVNDPELNNFYAHCARCHATREAFPPNFMQGSVEDVKQKMQRCADRIYYRLTMWQVPEAHRPKTPMPPATVSATQTDQWLNGGALENMRAYVAPFVDAKFKQSPENWLSRNYETLQSCTLH
jgi:hypothetical protein